MSFGTMLVLIVFIDLLLWKQIQGEKIPKHEVVILGGLIKHTADKDGRQSRHVLGERLILCQVVYADWHEGGM